MRFTLLLCLGLLVWPVAARATEPLSDCVIDNHVAIWELHADGSAGVAEDLTVNCGDLTGKHGIYRILPTRVPKRSRPANFRRETPVSYFGVTDGEGHSYPFKEEWSGDTLSVKIGDPNVLISGRLRYSLSYQMDNVVWPDFTTGQNHVDLNVVGQFWQLPIDRADITIKLPEGSPDLKPSVVRGGFGASQTSQTTTVTQTGPDTIHLNDENTFPAETGLTISFTTPATMFQIANPTYSTWEQWGGLLWLLWPVLIISGAWRVWKKYGQDIKLAKAEMVQYVPPAKLPVYEAFILQHNGSADAKALSGLIVGLAVRGYLTLERERSGLFGRQIVFTCVKGVDDELSASEKEIMDGLFGGEGAGASVSSKSLVIMFRQSVSAAQKAGQEYLKKKDWFENQSNRQLGWLTLAVLVLVGASLWVPFSGLLLAWLGPLAGAIALLGAIILAILMPRRTAAGAEVEWQLRGFQDYLRTAERYRLAFSEKENLFEKYLPYAVAFGVVKEWARAMRNLYGEDYWAHYHPIWYIGAFDVSDIDSFSAAISGVASDISSAMSAGTSGGSSGGGAGGGGGGSW